MVPILEEFIDALRGELEQYGEMLVLLEAPPELASNHTDTVSFSISALNSQSAAMETARRNRENIQRQLAWRLGVPEEQNVGQLTPLVPAEYRPLLTALAQEIQELLKRVRECARQNHQHLRRSLELMEEFISKLSPLGRPSLLGEDGPESGAADPPAPPASGYAAVI